MLNSLLGVLNERNWHNDGQVVHVPLLMAVGASNELPEDREELGALWDRFGLRYVVDYIRSDAAFDQMLAGAAPSTRRTLSLADVERARAEVGAVKLNGAAGAIRALRAKMAELRIPVSDRRWKAMLPVVKANAWLDGRTVAGEDDLSILAHALWQEPSQRVQVRQAVLGVANPINQRAMELLDQAREVHANAMNAWRAAKDDPAANASGAALETTKKLRNIVRELETCRKQCVEQRRDDARVAEALAVAVAANEEVLTECLGLSTRR